MRQIGIFLLCFLFFLILFSISFDLRSSSEENFLFFKRSDEKYTGDVAYPFAE